MIEMIKHNTIIAITEERKVELAQDLENYVNRYLDKQWIVAEAIDLLGMDGPEKRFLQSRNYEFKVY